MLYCSHCTECKYLVHLYKSLLLEITTSVLKPIPVGKVAIIVCIYTAVNFLYKYQQQH